MINNGWEQDYVKQREEFLKLEGYSEFEIKFAEMQSNTELLLPSDFSYPNFVVIYFQIKILLSKFSKSSLFTGISLS